MVQNTCEECGAESVDKRVWESCPECKTYNVSYEEIEDLEDENE